MELLWNKTISFIKVEMVFIISLLIVIGTSLFSKPRLSYIDFKVLMLLFSLMIVIRAFEELKLLDKIAIRILSKHRVLRMVSLTLTFLCFISSMFITNDVALITFVPLTLIIAKKANFNPVKTIILETLAANIGSSLTPMGNPQNLYLFSFYNISVIDFIKVTIVFVLIGGLWLFLLNHRIPNLDLEFDLDEIVIKNKRNIIVFSCLFIFILFSVFNLIDYRVAFATTVAVSLVIEKKLLREIDYFLLLTFVCFFIGIGNLSSMAVINRFMQRFMVSSGNVYFSSIVFSQFVSNVPCAILLSKFTGYWRQILLGVNIGGSGTIIASLASVISYKYYSKEYDGEKYLMKFTKYNFVTLTTFTFLFYFFIHTF